jgi:hypothetical protein
MLWSPTIRAALTAGTPKPCANMTGSVQPLALWASTRSARSSSSFSFAIAFRSMYYSRAQAFDRSAAVQAVRGLKVSAANSGSHDDKERPSDYPERAAVPPRDDGINDVPGCGPDEPAEFSSTWMRSDMAWTRPIFLTAPSTAEAF